MRIWNWFLAGAILPALLAASGPDARNLSPDQIFLRSTEALLRGETGIDYGAFREAYALSQPYKVMEIARLKARADLAFRMEEWGEASRLAVEIIRLNPTFAEAHMLLRSVYQTVGEAEEAAFHYAVARGLIDSILAAGDGSQSRPFLVVDDAEVRLILRLHGWGERTSSRSVGHGRQDARLEVVGPGGARTVWFRFLRPLGEEEPDEEDDDDL